MSAGRAAGAETFGAALAAARARLSASGSASPGLDARLLLAAATGLDQTAIVSRPEARLDDGPAAAFAAFVARRAGGEPVARILGRRDFWGLSLAVDGSTLVPRPDTETLVAAVLDAVRALRLPEAITICDLGTGSGAILIALLSELRSASGTGIDLSPAALSVAEKNAAACGVAGRCRFAVADLASFADGPFDVVVSNPPYVVRGDIAGLDRDVRDWDPHLALDGGEDGLDAYRAIAAGLGRLLEPGGLLALEVGAGQAQAVADLLAGAGMAELRTVRDLAGMPRVVAGLHAPGLSGAAG